MFVCCPSGRSIYVSFFFYISYVLRNWSVVLILGGGGRLTSGLKWGEGGG